MKLGMPTLVEFNSIKENYLLAKENNLDFIELNMNLPYCFNLKEKELLDYDIEFTMHISEELHIGELNESIRNKYLDIIKEQINLGISNNIKRFNIHLNLGIYFTLIKGKYFLNSKYEDLYLKNLKNSLEELNTIAKENNILINLENTKIEDFINKAIKETLNYHYLGFTLDIGHNEKNKDKAFNNKDFISKIRHIHIHDYDLVSDHLELGTGIINFNKYKDLLLNNYIVLEVKEKKKLINSIKYFKEKIS